MLLKIVAAAPLNVVTLGAWSTFDSRVALGGREEEIDFQVAQERDAERAARARLELRGGDLCLIGTRVREIQVRREVRQTATLRSHDERRVVAEGMVADRIDQVRTETA